MADRYVDMGGFSLKVPQDMTDEQARERYRRVTEPTPPEQIGQAYQEYVAAPLTGAVAGAINPVIEAATSTLPRAINKLAPSWFPNAPSPEQAYGYSQGAAEFVVPQTLSEAASVAGPVVISPLTRAMPWGRGAVARVAGGAAGGALGASMSGEDPLYGAARGATGGTVGEVTGAAVPWALRATVGRNTVSASRMRNVAGEVERAVPEYKALMETITQEVKSPYLARSSRPAAALHEAARSERGRDVLGQHLETGIRRAEALHQHATGTPPMISGPGITQAYTIMPDLDKQHLVGQVALGPDGSPALTLRQAQEVLAWTGGKAFSKAPAAEGTSDITQQIIWTSARGDVERALHPKAAAEFFRAKHAYGIGEAVHDMIRAGGLQAEPDRILAAHRTIEMELAKNSAEYIRRMGPENFERLWQAVAPGAVKGTASRMPAGAGTPLSRLEGLARSTGDITRIPTALATVPFPSLGAQWAGRPPFRRQSPTGQAVLLDWPAIQSIYGISGFGQQQ